MQFWLLYVIMTGYRATAYQTNNQNINIRTLCICSHITQRATLRQLVFNLVAIGFLCDAQTENNYGPEFAHMLTQNIQAPEDVDTICRTYGKPEFNTPGGWTWQMYYDA